MFSEATQLDQQLQHASQFICSDVIESLLRSSIFFLPHRFSKCCAAPEVEVFKRLDVDVVDVPEVVAACCVLHNICECHGEEFSEEWLEGVESQVSLVPLQ